MKRKLSTLFLGLTLLLGLTTSCLDNVSGDVSISEVRHGRKLATSLSMAPMEHEAATKSLLGSRGEAVVYNWNLFVFDGGVLVGKYYKDSGEDIEFSVELDREYDFLALANVGNRTGSFGAGATLLDVKDMVLTGIDISSNGLPMSWSGSDSFSRAEYEAGTARLGVQLTRLVGKYEIVVNRGNLVNWSLSVTSLTMRGTASVKPFSEAGTNAGTSNSTVNDAATAADISLLNTGSPAVFYPVENVFPTPASLSGNTDPWSKVPDDDNNGIGGKFPSYVELVGTATLLDGSNLSKSVTYRFYLGQNATTDFSVVRNVSHSITFYPDDETIENGHNDNWKITPGPVGDDRSLAFSRRTAADSRFRVRAGTSSDEAVVRVPEGLTYRATSASANVAMTNTATGAAIASGSVTDASSITLAFAPGAEELTSVHIRTLDGAKYDDLYLDIFDAYLSVLPDDPITWDWNEHTQKDVTVTATVPWTAAVPAGWSLAYASGGAVSGEQPAGTDIALKILPPASDYMDIAEDATATLSFSAEGTDGDAVTLIRRYKPQVTSGGSNEASLSWNWDESGGDDAKVLTISSNEDWVVVWPEGDRSHWDVSPEGGAATATSITAYPVEDNDSPAAITGTFYVVPVRNGNNVDDGRLTVTLTHNPNDPYIEVSGGDLTEGALRWLWYQKQAKAFTVAANIPWEVVPDEAATASFNISANAATGVVTVTPKDYNYVTGALSGSVTVRGTGDFASMAQVVPLSQSRYPSITVDPASYDWQRNDYSDHSFTVSIAADETYQCRFAAYVQDGSQYSSHFGTNHSASTYVGDGESFVIYPTSNCTPTSPSIYGYVYVYLSGASGAYGEAAIPHVSVPLSWGAQPYIDITGDDLENGALKWVWYQNEEAVKTFRVTSNIAWEVVPDAGATASFDISANTSTGVITVAPKGSNSVTSALSGSITVRGTGSNASVTGTVAVRQSRYPQIVADPLSYSWVRGSYDVQSFDLLILADEDYDRCTYSVWGVNGARYDTYFSCLGTYASPDGPSGPGTPVRIRPKSACGEISSGLNAYVLVILDGDFGNAAPPRTSIPITWGADPYLDITPNAASLTWYWYEDDANAQVIAVSSNVAWETSITGADADKFARVRDGENIRVYPVAQNGLERALDATLNITVPSATTLNRTVSLSQTKHPVLTASPATVTFPWDWTSGASTVTVTSDIGWTAALDADGSANFTISASSGSGDGSITVSPKGQNTDEVNAKTGRIIFTGVGEHNTGITCEVALSQNKKQAKVYTDAYFKIEGYDHFGFHDANTYKAYVIGVYDGGEDILDDVTASATWSCEGGFSSYVESAALASGDYRVQVKNTTTGTLTGRVSASFTGTYESIYVYNDDHIDVTVDAYPYLAAHDVTVAWNDTDWHDAWSTNVSSGINVTGYDSDWCNCQFGYGIRATGNNTGSSSRSCTVTVSGYAHDYLDDVDIPVSGTFTFTQEANAGPAYNTYTAAYVDVDFTTSGYTVDVGGTKSVSARLYVGTATATSVPQNESDYSWDGGTDVTASGFYSGDTGVATVSGSTVTGVAAGTATIYSEHYINPSDYDKVFDQKTVTIHVNGSGPEPVVTYQYKVVTSVDPSSTTVGSSVTASADLYRKTFEDGVATTGWVYQGDVTSSGFNRQSGVSVSITGSSVTGNAAGEAVIRSNYSADEYEDATVTFVPQEPVVTYQYKVVTSVDPSSTTVGSSVTASADLYRKTFEDGVATTGWVYQGDVTSSGFNKQGGVSVSISGSSVTGNAEGDAYIRSNYSADEYEDAKVTFTDPDPVVTYQYKVVTSVDPSSTTVGSSVTASADLYRKTFEDGVATTDWVYQSNVTSSGFNRQGGVSVSISGSSVTGNAAGDAYIRSNYSADEYEDATVTFIPGDVLQSIWFGSELTPSSNYDYGTLSIANDFTKSYRVWANYSLSGTREITYDPDLSISASNGVSWSGGTISKGTSQTGASIATASFNGKSNTAHVYVQHGYLLVSANVESTDIGVGSQFNLIVSGNFEETWGSGVMHNDEDFRNAGAISCTYHDSEVTVTVVSASQVRITFSNSISDGSHGITLQFKNRTGLNGSTNYDNNTVSVDYNFITEGGTARPVIGN